MDRFSAAIDVVKAAPLFWAAPFLRPWHLHWGATASEANDTMPGDELLHGAQFRATRAVSIAATPDKVWPWIVQIGFRRAGFYSYDLFDNLGHPSADRIVPELQDIRIGDWIAMAEPVNEVTAFKVASFVPNRWMVWHKPDSTWAWRLDPTSDGGTRLVTRLKTVYDLDHAGPALVSIVLMEFADFPMMRRLLRNLKRRAETT